MHFKLRVIFFFYLFFVIYGSLVPLIYVYIPFDVAVNRFFNIRFLDLGVTSRADWVANGLLFIPLTFLWLAAFWSEVISFRKYFLIVTALAISVCLPLLIEFTQLYFPTRTVSQNDIMAEAIGGLIGILSWLTFKEKFMHLMAGLFSKTFADKWRVYLTIYLVCMLAYSIMPLDLTLSPVELYRKWDKGLLILIPFQFVKNDFITIAYDLIGDVVLWIPVTFFLIRSGSFTTPQIYKRVFYSALLIEFCQVFVFSRYTDVNDLMTALLGAYVGIQIFKRWHSITEDEEKLQAVNHAYIGYAGYALWCCLLTLVYWYPFEFNLSNGHIGPSLRLFFSVPFASYYIGSEYLAITQIFRKLLFALPLGVFLAVILRNYGFLSVSIKRFIMVFVLFTTVFFFELVQMLVPVKTANLTDVIVSFMGALIGFNAVQPFLDKYLLNKNKDESKDAIKPDENTGFKRLSSRVNFDKKYLPILAKVLVLYSALFIVYNIPAVPYNVKELYAGGAVLGSLGLTLVFLHCLGFPLAAVHYAIHQNELNRTPWLRYFLGHILVAWLLIRVFIPFEAIYDIVGYPTWGVVFELELAFRFFGFFALISGALFLAAITFTSFADHKAEIKSKLVINTWLLYFVVVVPWCFIVVVALAGTDNIIELLPNEGYSFYCLFIVLYFIFTFCLATKLSLTLKSGRVKKISLLVFLTIVSTPIMFYFMQLGTENYVLKYKKIFSALQFLLSTDRKSYADPSALMIRFAIAHLAFIGLFMMTQWYGLNRAGKQANK